MCRFEELGIDEQVDAEFVLIVDDCEDLRGENAAVTAGGCRTGRVAIGWKVACQGGLQLRPGNHLRNSCEDLVGGPEAEPPRLGESERLADLSSPEIDVDERYARA